MRVVCFPAGLSMYAPRDLLTDNGKLTLILLALLGIIQVGRERAGFKMALNR